MTPHLGFRLDGVHIEGYLVYLKCKGIREKEGEGEENEGRRWRGGGDALGSDATFPWSRGLTHPLRCNQTRHRVWIS